MEVKRAEDLSEDSEEDASNSEMCTLRTFRYLPVYFESAMSVLRTVPAYKK